MAESLRNKQIREVLDIWKDVNRQVFDRERVQVQAFDEEVLPKKTRDLDVEVNVDKAVDMLNAALESKLVSLESVIDTIGRTLADGEANPDRVDADLKKNYKSSRGLIDILKTGDFVAQWNNLIRMYQTPSLARSSQESFKVKVQLLNNNLEAIVYGYSRVIDEMFTNGFFDPSLLAILTSAATFRIALGQLRRNSYFPIDPASIDSEYKKVVAEQSRERREIIEDTVSRIGHDGRQKGIMMANIRNVPDFKSSNRAEYERRLNALGTEYGIHLPYRFRDKIVDRLNIKDFDEVLEKLKEDNSATLEQRRHFKEAAKEIRAENDSLIHQHDMVEKAMNEIADRYRRNHQMLLEHEREAEEKKTDEYDDVIDDMRQRDTLLERRYDQLRQELDLIMTRVAEVQASFQNLQSYQGHIPRTRDIDLRLKPEVDERAQRPVGQGRVHNRRMASLGKHYGARDSSSESSSDSEDDSRQANYEDWKKRRQKPVQYEERRNDMYSH
jgi:hypothetical protein